MGVFEIKPLPRARLIDEKTDQNLTVSTQWILFQTECMKQRLYYLKTNSKQKFKYRLILVLYRRVLFLQMLFRSGTRSPGPENYFLAALIL